MFNLAGLLRLLDRASDPHWRLEITDDACKRIAQERAELDMAEQIMAYEQRAALLDIRDAMTGPRKVDRLARQRKTSRSTMYALLRQAEVERHAVRAG